MLAEMLLVGDVSIPKSYFKEYFSNIHHPVKFNKSMLELQFEVNAFEYSSIHEWFHQFFLIIWTFISFENVKTK